MVLYICLLRRYLIVYKSSQLNIKLVFSSRPKKRVRTCRAHCVIGIAKHHQGNEQKKQIPHAVAYRREMCTAEAVHPLAYTQKTE